MHNSFTVTSEAARSGISFSPTSTTNSAEDEIRSDSGLLELSTQGQIAIALTSSDTVSDKNSKVLDYQKLVAEHAELIQQGKSSVEIAQWIGDKLNIPSWKAGEFYGERKVLSSPKTSEETERLRKFVEALGIYFSNMNQPSKNHPQYLLLDGYIQNALFGSANMAQVDARLNTFCTDWEEMGNVWSTSKERYLLEKIGLDIKGDWFTLTGIIEDYEGQGIFSSPENLYASGALDGNKVPRLWLFHFDSDVSLKHASRGCLCFLA